MTDKKNPDYTASAISITNPQEIEILLGQRRAISRSLVELKTILEALPAYKQIGEGETQIAFIDKTIIAFIDEKGGYQDTDAGLYALRQRRVSLSYTPDRLRQCIPKWADAVINEVVDPKQVNQLLKSKLITESEIEPATIKKETTRIIIEA